MKIKGFLYIRGHKTAAFRPRIGNGRSIFRSKKPWALARGASFTLPFIFLANIILAEEIEKRFLVVSVPVADIRKEPKDASAMHGHDAFQETQTLFNEVLLHRSSSADWYYVEAIEQPEFTHNGYWQGYPGYIKKDKARFIERQPEYNLVVNSAFADIFDTSSPNAKVLLRAYLGTRFRTIGDEGDLYKIEMHEGFFAWVRKSEVARIDTALDRNVIRGDIIKTAKLFLKSPYLWGGRSFFTPFARGTATGVDCSGFINLIYRANGVDIPRDAQEQWMLTEDIGVRQLKPTDLIFISDKNKFESIVHVMLFIGGEDFIEAPGTGKMVSVNNFKNKFRLSLKELEAQNFVADGKKVYLKRIKGIPR